MGIATLRPQVDCGIPHDTFLDFAAGLDDRGLALLERDLELFQRTGVMGEMLIGALDEVFGAPLLKAA